MRGLRLTRMILRAAVRENNRSRRQQQRKKVQTKSKVALKNVYPAYVPSQASQQYYQPPQPPPYGNQPSPVQPGQFQPPPAYPPYNQQRPLPHEPFTRWFSRQERNTKIGCVCFSLIGMLVLCGMCGAIGNAANANQGTTATVPTTIVVITTDTPTTVVQAIQPTNTPTMVPTLTPKPTPKPTLKPTPTQPIVQRPTPISRPQSTPTPCANPCNPWGYNFNQGNLIYSPNGGFCSDFNCISNFWHGNGFVNECNDGSYSKSGGIRGDCSHHGGEMRPLYSH